MPRFRSVFFDAIKHGVCYENLTTIDDEVMRLVFATRDQSLKDITKGEVPNILGFIDKLDKHLWEDKPDRAVRQVYDFLSEFVHPNWVGTVGLFGELNEVAAYFSENNSIKGMVASHVIAGLGSASIVAWCYRGVLALLPEVTEIAARSGFGAISLRTS